MKILHTIKYTAGEIKRGIVTSWKHKHTLLTLSLLVALIWPVGVEIVGEFIPKSEASYTKTEDRLTEIEEIVNKRGEEIFDASVPMYKERARLEAIQEVNQELMSKMDNSPFVDYQALEERYGY